MACLEVLQSAWQAMLDHAATAEPCEACGLLLGQGGQVMTARPAANVAADPLHQFEIDPRALIDAFRDARRGGAQVLGYYHSHPNGLARPSATDRARANRDGMVWAIVAVGAVHFFRDAGEGFDPLEHEIPY